jgi:hypothetical protein
MSHGFDMPTAQKNINIRDFYLLAGSAGMRAMVMTSYPDAGPSASGHICDEGLDTFFLDLDSDQEGARSPARVVR